MSLALNNWALMSPNHEFPVFSSPEPKAAGELRMVGLRPPSVCPPFSNLAETAGPILNRVHMQPSDSGGIKVGSDGPGHLTKLAAMPIYSKNL